MDESIRQAARDQGAAMGAVLTNFATNFRELAAICAHCPKATELKNHLNGLKHIEVDDDYFGPYAKAARIVLDCTISSMDGVYTELHAHWQKNLDELRAREQALPWDAATPAIGPVLYEALQRLEQSGEFKPETFGDLSDQAIAFKQAFVQRLRDTLARITVMVYDPVWVPDEWHGDPDLLEGSIAQFEALEPKLEDFNGDDLLLAQALALKPLALAKQVALLEKVRAREEQQATKSAERGIEHREESEHRNRVNDAGMTQEERARRLQRAIEAAEPMFLLVRRITEISHMQEGEHTGAIDANGLLEVVQRAHAMVARVEGRLN